MLRMFGPGDPDGLRRTLRSLSGQIYRDWQVIVPDEVRGADLAPDLLGRFLHQDGGDWQDRVDFVAILGVGDILGADALAEIALEAALSPSAELIYADEYRPPACGDPHEPFYKPDYSPNLLLATNYIGRPWFASVQLLRRAGITPRSLLSKGEYDALLRCAEVMRDVRHVPRLLCERGADGDTVECEHNALRAATARRGLAGEVTPGLIAGSWHLLCKAPRRSSVSIIIPTCAAGGHIESCIRSLRATTADHDIEIVCIENIAPESAHWRVWLKANVEVVVSTGESFNWSRFNNIAAGHASGDFLLFLNDDIEAECAGWLDALLQHGAREEVGVVGARLLYPNRTVQHAGMFLSEAGIGRHAFRFAAEDDPGYFGLALTVRDVSAVTGACMLMRRQHFEALGGFDETHEVVNNDLDFCLRTTDANRQVVYTPYATLIHHEQASRAAMPDKYDLQRFNMKWYTRFAKGDPFYNPNLSTSSDDFTLNEEPVRIVRSGHPLFDAGEIQRILVVKVDHIGDFVTALPAIRRLKSHFPDAEISVLAAPAAVAFADLEPAITEILPFEFFHARSALGQKTITEADLAALRARLTPRKFDLAVDLRKQLDTRRLLLATGARLLAGFDRAGDFPWLDIALEWEGDLGLHAKRSHIADDLLNLVQSIAAAADQNRVGLSAAAIAALREANPPPDGFRTFFLGPVVCLHPGAGNEMKQWPENSFVALADLLVQELGANVLVIGGPDEADIADRVAAGAADPVGVRSVAGFVPLRALPALISRCALFVGNDSGPKHIAALVGVPTIGIHSGTVDPTEWAPFGQELVAIARVMRCSPCYFHRPSDCMRSLACIKQIPVAAIFQLCRRSLARKLRETSAGFT